jgi:hypothetical protein
MKMFHIKVTEVSSKVVSLRAKSLEDAITQVENSYRDEEIVLDYSDFDSVDFQEADLIPKFE